MGKRETCGNCAHWHILTSSSVVGFHDDNTDRMYNGLCMESGGNTKAKTTSNTNCMVGKYRDVRMKIRLQSGEKNHVRCGGCGDWDGMLIDKDGRKDFYAVGSCEQLGRNTQWDDSCLNAHESRL